MMRWRRRRLSVVTRSRWFRLIAGRMSRLWWCGWFRIGSRVVWRLINGRRSRPRRSMIIIMLRFRQRGLWRERMLIGRRRRVGGGVLFRRRRFPSGIVRGSLLIFLVGWPRRFGRFLTAETISNRLIPRRIGFTPWRRWRWFVWRVVFLRRGTRGRLLMLLIRVLLLGVFGRGRGVIPRVRRLRLGETRRFMRLC